MRQRVVLRHALAQIVSAADIILRARVPLFCGPVEPLCGLNPRRGVDRPWNPMIRTSVDLSPHSYTFSTRPFFSGITSAFPSR
jgi:hypothetical protein